MDVSSFCTTQNFPGILQCQQNAPLAVAIRHAPEILHTSLWPVLVHILECPYKGKKGVRVNMQSRGLELRCLDLILRCMELKIKWVYKQSSFSVFKRILLFFTFISTSPFLHTRISSLRHHIALETCSILNSSSLILTSILNEYVSKSSVCVDSYKGAFGK